MNNKVKVALFILALTPLAYLTREQWMPLASTAYRILKLDVFFEWVKNGIAPFLTQIQTIMGENSIVSYSLTAGTGAAVTHFVWRWVAGRVKKVLRQKSIEATNMLKAQLAQITNDFSHMKVNLENQIAILKEVNRELLKENRFFEAQATALEKERASLQAQIEQLRAEKTEIYRQLERLKQEEPARLE